MPIGGNPVKRFARKIKLMFVAPSEIEGLRNELLKATRATEAAQDRHNKVLDRAGVTRESESVAYKALGNAHIKQLLALKILNLAKESYLRNGFVNVESIKSQLADKGNKTTIKRSRH